MDHSFDSMWRNLCCCSCYFYCFFFVGLEDGPNQMTCPKYITDERGHPLNGGHFRTCCGLFLIEMIIGLFYLRLCIVYLLIWTVRRKLLDSSIHLFHGGRDTLLSVFLIHTMLMAGANSKWIEYIYGYRNN